MQLQNASMVKVELFGEMRRFPKLDRGRSLHTPVAYGDACRPSGTVDRRSGFGSAGDTCRNPYGSPRMPMPAVPSAASGCDVAGGSAARPETRRITDDGMCA